MAKQFIIKNGKFLTVKPGDTRKFAIREKPGIPAPTDLEVCASTVEFNKVIDSDLTGYNFYLDTVIGPSDNDITSSFLGQMIQHPVPLQSLLYPGTALYPND